MMRLLSTVLLGLLCAIPAQAEPLRYELDEAASSVGFTYSFLGRDYSGQMPVRSAFVVIDPQNIPASRVRVTIEANRARAASIPATVAMHSTPVLDTETYPLISFESSRVIFHGGVAATIEGEITIRGVTRPISLDAKLGRRAETPPDNLSRLVVLMSGEISRSAFGADGFADSVDDTIGLDILADIVLAE